MQKRMAAASIRVVAVHRTCVAAPDHCPVQENALWCSSAKARVRGVAGVKKKRGGDPPPGIVGKSQPTASVAVGDVLSDGAVYISGVDGQCEKTC